MHTFAGHRVGLHNRGRAFTLLELQVTLVILAVGLLSFAGLLAVQGRQLRRVEQWCSSSPTYYVVSQSDRWMRQLRASAKLESTAGQSAWTPPVTGTDQYTVTLTSQVRDLDSQQMSGSVQLQLIEE